MALNSEHHFSVFCRSGDPRVAPLGGDGSGCLVRLSSVHWPWLKSSEGLNGVGGPAPWLSHVYAWRISASCRGSQFLAVWSTFMARRASFLRTGFRREAQAAMCFMTSSHPVTSTISFWLYVLAVYCGG